MFETVAFRTQARTIDHLGREQIADCPTAVSELWKNAYDAYARRVALHLFDGNVSVAAVMDDGHGMNKEEFLEKWLVVGTEAKAVTTKVSAKDRDGLPYRPRQGQKGIGRLSCAALGPLLLVVSKRKTDPFVAALIDWRLFENPFLLLEDIRIPVIEFKKKNELHQYLPKLFDRHMGNVWGDSDDEGRDKRIAKAWKEFDKLEKEEERPLTRKAIEDVAIELAFEDRHLEQWPLWTGERDQGTALFIADLSFDLQSQLSLSAKSDVTSAEQHSRDRFFQTLSNFTDPFIETDKSNELHPAAGFHYSVTAWNGDQNRPIISDTREFDVRNLDNLEHIIDGEINERGYFKGRIKAFGEWLEGQVSIRLRTKISRVADSKAGPFRIHFGTYERQEKTSSLPESVRKELDVQAKLYGGFMVFRDGLRVMPYGRVDNDFFEIEQRRTMHAGREFWANRRMFGRVAITRKDNPNLKDKAGREGLIDNLATKTFRDLVIEVLVYTAHEHFGTDSKRRKEKIPGMEAQWKEKTAEKERQKHQKKQRRYFRSRLKEYSPGLSGLLNEVSELADGTDEQELKTEADNRLKKMYADVQLQNDVIKEWLS